MTDTKAPSSNIPWPVWAFVSIAVVSIPAYFTYKANVEKQGNEFVPKPNTEKDNELRDTDEQLTQKLTGTWNGMYDVNGVMYDATITYNSNGNFTGRTTLSNQSGTMGIVYYSGNWHISDRYNTLTVTNTNSPQFLPVGTITKTKIESINGKESTYIDYQGVKRNATKIN